MSQAGRVLHLVTPNQFLDSPEWFGVTTDEYFQVSVTALEECSVLVWHRDKIKLQIMEDEHLQAVLDHVVGRDVVRKLMQVNRIHSSLLSEQGCSFFKVQNISEELTLLKNSVQENSDNLSIDEDRDEYDDKKPMISKESNKDKSLIPTIIGIVC